MLVARMSHHRLLRLPRKAAVMLVLAIYVIAGALHGACGLDVTNPAGEHGAVIAMADLVAGHADFPLHKAKGGCAADKCHGCFSVSLPDVHMASITMRMAARNALVHDAEPRDLPRAIEPPPPRLLI